MVCTVCRVRPMIRATFATGAGPWSTTPSTCQRAEVSPEGWPLISCGEQEPVEAEHLEHQLGERVTLGEYIRGMDRILTNWQGPVNQEGEFRLRERAVRGYGWEMRTLDLLQSISLSVQRAPECSQNSCSPAAPKGW